MSLASNVPGKVCIYSTVQSMNETRTAGHHVTSPQMSVYGASQLLSGLVFQTMQLILRFENSQKSHIA